jgi:hypothetical protein
MKEFEGNGPPRTLDSFFVRLATSLANADATMLAKLEAEKTKNGGPGGSEKIREINELIDFVKQEGMAVSLQLFIIDMYKW